MQFKSWILSILIICLGGLCTWYFYSTKPIAKKAAPRLSSPVVMTVPSEVITTPLHLRALGTVKPSQEIVLRSRVAGTVIELSPNFQPGSLVKQGEVLLQIDPADYLNEVKLKESTLAKAKADYEIELGQQKVAKAEFDQLNKTMPNSLSQTKTGASLALRAPHLAQAKSALDTAQTNLDQTKLALARTTLTAPFNAMVTSRNISLGSQASTSDALASLVGTDTYWIEAALPLDKIGSLGVASYADIPAKILSSTGQEFNGKVLRSLGSLDTSTRMGRILIEVANPQAEQNSPHQLLLGDQVQVELKAGSLEDVIVLPRSALRGGDVVWIFKAGTLDIRPVQVLWKDVDKVYLAQGIEPEEAIITSDLATPLQGMNLRQPRTATAQEPQSEQMVDKATATTQPLSTEPVTTQPLTTSETTVPANTVRQ